MLFSEFYEIFQNSFFAEDVPVRTSEYTQEIKFKIVSYIIPWTQDVNLTYIRRSEDVLDVF